MDGRCRRVVKPSFVTVRALIRRGSRALLRTTAWRAGAAATSFTKVYRTVARPELSESGSLLCYSLHVQRETAFNVSAIKDTVLRSIKLNQQAYNNRDADVLREVYLEPMLSQVAHDLSGDFESFPAARLDITCEVLDVSYTAYLQIGKVELSAYGLEASPQNVNVTTKEEWIYRLVPDAEKGVGLGRRTTHRFLGYYHYTLVDIDGRWWITDVQSASEIWLP
jgi:hypothetical protein